MAIALGKLMRWIGLLLMLALSFVPAQSAIAAFCRDLDGHSVCILDLKRSAKYYWEYRAVVRVDGIERPMELYNCRDRTYRRQDGKVIRFEPNSPGELICTLMKH